MMKNKAYLILSMLLFLGANISVFGQGDYADSDAIKKLITKKREYNKKHKPGFRIQLYNGLEKRAKSTKFRFETEYPNISTKLLYNQPEWKTQVGHYQTRLEADRALNKIREKFSGAIVVPAD